MASVNKVIVLGNVGRDPETRTFPDGGQVTPDHPITDAEDDPLYDPAVAIVRQHDKASISLVQRHLMIGYNRADRMIERMEKDGIVSPMDMSGSRTVLKG